MFPALALRWSVSRLEALCHFSNLSLAILENPDTLPQELFQETIVAYNHDL